MEQQLYTDLEAAREEIKRIKQGNPENKSTNVLEESEQTKANDDEKEIQDNEVSSLNLEDSSHLEASGQMKWFYSPTSILHGLEEQNLQSTPCTRKETLEDRQYVNKETTQTVWGKITKIRANYMRTAMTLTTVTQQT